MPKNDRYPRTLDVGYLYAFAGYVADLGRDLMGIGHAITAILLDLELDPSSKADRKWAINKFRVANPNYYDPDNKKKTNKCKQQYYDYFLVRSSFNASNFVSDAMSDQNRSDMVLQQLIKELQLETIKANWKDVSDDVKAQLLIETIKAKFISGDRKLEIASLALKLQESVDGDEGDDVDPAGGSLQTGEE